MQWSVYVLPMQNIFLNFKPELGTGTKFLLKSLWEVRGIWIISCQKENIMIYAIFNPMVTSDGLKANQKTTMFTHKLLTSKT